LPDDDSEILEWRNRPKNTQIQYLAWPYTMRGSNPSFPVSWAQNDALTAELQAHCREESLSWRDFEGSITNEYEQMFDIFAAQLATGNDVLSIRMSGYHHDSGFREVYLRAEKMPLGQVGGEPSGFEGLRKLSKGFGSALQAGKLDLTSAVPES
jgi:hypothetical protein